jgi:acyl-CoA synthetase (AMP-forming)/AMP-acid ligase II
VPSSLPVESRRGSRLAAICLSGKPGLRPPRGALELLRLLPRYTMPDDMLIVATLPQTPSSKIDRRALRDSRHADL